MLAELDGPPAAVTVAFVGRRVMGRLNGRFRSREYPTDVLSFPYPGESVDGLPYLGEIVIAPDVAAENARGAGALEGELRSLLVHGLLHLLGYDHETDSGQMLRLQARLLRRPALSAFPLGAVPARPARTDRGADSPGPRR